MVEQDISSSSRPWIEIRLGPVDKKPLYRISTVQSDTGSWNKDGEFVADGSALITSASIGGMVPMGRKGSFTIKDLTGVWPSRISDLGRYSSDMSKAPGPNMSFEFGWRGLKPNKEYSQGSQHSDKLTAFILSSKFDIGEDASITIELEFNAYSSIILSDIMAFNWNDVAKSDPERFWKNND